MLSFARSARFRSTVVIPAPMRRAVVLPVVVLTRAAALILTRAARVLPVAEPRRAAEPRVTAAETWAKSCLRRHKS